MVKQQGSSCIMSVFDCVQIACIRRSMWIIWPNFTYLFTYLITHFMQRSTFEKVTGLQLVKKFPAFYGT